MAASRVPVRWFNGSAVRLRRALSGKRPIKTKERGVKILQKSIIRTLSGRLVTVKQLDLNEEQVSAGDYLVPLELGTDKDKLLKYIRKQYEDPSIRVLSVKRSRIIKEVYEISLTDFLKYAKKVPEKRVPEKLHLRKRR